jgi:isopenicillin N synthase-like dioxygenase
MSDFPVIDLAAFEAASEEKKRQMGREVDLICRASGFLAVRNHGIPDDVISGVWNQAHDFFDLPYVVKDQSRAPYPGYPYGYLGPGAEALARSKGVDSPPDLKESFNGGPLSVPPGLTDEEALAFCYAATIWPDDPQDFRPAWEAYYSAVTNLAARIMRVFAVALDLPKDYFQSFISAPISALRALNYPELDAPPPEGQLRAGAHTDYGSLTILLPQPGSKGLEIMTPEGAWREVPPVDGAFVINIGDLMARWTNDRWVSTLHRVVNVSPDDGGLARRQSLAFFHQPDWFASIETLPSCLVDGEVSKYEPVLSGPYLMAKFKKTVM